MWEYFYLFWVKDVIIANRDGESKDGAKPNNDGGWDDLRSFGTGIAL